MEITKLLFDIVFHPGAPLGYRDLERWLSQNGRGPEAEAIRNLIRQKFPSHDLAPNPGK